MLRLRLRRLLRPHRRGLPSRASRIEIGGGIGNLKRRSRRRDLDRHPVLRLGSIASPMRSVCPSRTHAPRTSSWSTCCIISNFPSPSSARPRACCARRARVMVEPAITWGSSLFYRLLHHEPVRTLGMCSSRAARGRAAIPTTSTRPSRPFSPPASASGFIASAPAAHRLRGMVLVRGLSAERRFPALEPRHADFGAPPFGVRAQV